MSDWHEVEDEKLARAGLRGMGEYEYNTYGYTVPAKLFYYLDKATIPHAPSPLLERLRLEYGKACEVEGADYEATFRAVLSRYSPEEQEQALRDFYEAALAMKRLDDAFARQHAAEQAAARAAEQAAEQAAARPRRVKCPYKDATYRKLRKVVLLDDPICTICGVAPSEVCDHINGDSTDNRRDNLRAACRSCNARKAVLNEGAGNHSVEHLAKMRLRKDAPWARELLETNGINLLRLAEVIPFYRKHNWYAFQLRSRGRYGTYRDSVVFSRPRSALRTRAALLASIVKEAGEIACSGPLEAKRIAKRLRGIKSWDEVLQPQEFTPGFSTLRNE